MEGERGRFYDREFSAFAAIDFCTETLSLFISSKRERVRSSAGEGTFVRFKNETSGRL